MYSSFCNDDSEAGIKKLLEACGGRLAAITSQFGDMVQSPYHPAEGLLRHKHFEGGKLSPFMDFLGVVRRYVPYKNKSFRDPVVEDWIAADQIEMEEAYQMCSPNSAAMTKSISKYNRAQPQLNEAAWKIAGDWTEKHFRPFMGESLVLPLEGVIKKADRTTSAGYPWSLWFYSKGELIDSPRFAELMQKAWDSLSSDEPYVPIWTASLKLELRPIEKIDTNSIRTFTASPTEHSVNCNRLCLDMNERFYASNNSTWSFVGCSKYNRGFDNLYKRLSKHPNAFELDETSFDASLFVRALEGQRDMRWGLLHPCWKETSPGVENTLLKKKMWNIYDSIIHSVIVLDNGEVVQKHTGNPSGSANTIVDNTMILFRLFAYAWSVLAAEQHRMGNVKFMSYADFMINVEAALNGDDNTFTCSNKVVSWFNPAAISRVWTGIGVITTTPSFEPRALKDVCFLSHGFIEIDGVWLPIPEREKVLCSLLMASEYSDPRWTLLRASALRIESWPCKRTRAELSSLIARIHREHSAFLKGNCKGIPIEEIKGVWKTDGEIHRLYCMLRKPEMAPTLKEESMRKTLSLVAKFGMDYQPGAGCDAPLFEAQSKREWKLAIELNEEPDIDVDDYVNVEVPLNKWRGKGLGWKKGFQFLNDEKLSEQYKLQKVRVLKTFGDTEVRTPYKMPAKRARAKGKGKSQNKPNRPAPRGGGGNRKKRGGPRGNMSGAGPTYSAPMATGRVFQNRQSRVTRISHRESLGPVTATSAAFAVLFNLPINPALPTSFPWLSNIAAQYETYAPTRRAGKRKGARVHSIRYCYEQRTASTTTGTVVMATNYDSAEGPFTSLTQAENYRGASVTSPWINACHEIEVDAMRDINRHYCRAGAPPSGTDIRLYDVGNFQLIVSGVTAVAGYPAQIGELYVEYDIDFYDPRVPVPLGQNLPCAHLGNTASNGTAAAPLTGATVRAGSTLGVTIPSTATFNIPLVGEYLIGMAFVTGSTNIAASPTLTATNAAVVNLFGNNTQGSEASFTSEISNYLGVWSVTAPNAVFTIAGNTSGTAMSTDVFITQISTGLLRPAASLEAKERAFEEKTQHYESVLRSWGVQDAMSVLQTDEKSWSDIDRQTVKLFGEEARKELAKERNRPPRLARAVPRRLAPPVLDQDLSDEEKGFEKVLATPASAKTSKSGPGK